MEYIDMWYDDKIEDVTRIDIQFYGADASYRGNIYIDDKCVGDYIAYSSTELEKAFPQLTFNWD